MSTINHYRRDRDGMEQTAEAGTTLDQILSKDPEYSRVEPAESRKSPKPREHSKNTEK